MRIKTESEYESALQRIDELWDAAPDTSEGQELDALVLAVEEYEDERYPMDEPKSYAAIQFHLERLGLSIDELSLSKPEKEMLASCISNSTLVPEWLVLKAGNILNVPRDVLGQSADQYVSVAD